MTESKNHEDLPSVEGVNILEELNKAAAPAEEGLISLLGIPQSELTKIVNDRIEQEGGLEFLNHVRESGSNDNLLYFSVDATAGEVTRVRDYFATLGDTVLDPILLDAEGRPTCGTRVVVPPKTKGSQPVSGTAGIVSILASRRGNIRRIPLYNSGFSIDIRVPTVDEVSTLIRKCRLDKADYESQMGAPFYMFFDRILKVNFIELLMRLVVFSSCKNWEKEGVLLSAIKLADLNALLASVAGIMYPKGYPNFRHYCTRPVDKEHPAGCDHVTSIKADIAKLIHTRFSALNTDAIIHMTKSLQSSTVIGDAERQQYQEWLGFDGTEIKTSEFTFVLHTPSLAAHLEAAAVFNGELLNEVRADNAQGIVMALRPRDLRLYSQFVKTVKVYDDNGEEVNTSNDQVVISYVLDLCMDDEETRYKLLKEFKAFVNTSQLSYVCYKKFKCASCGYEPPIGSDYFTVDAQTAFFTTALLKSTNVS